MKAFNNRSGWIAAEGVGVTQKCTSTHTKERMLANVAMIGLSDHFGFCCDDICERDARRLIATFGRISSPKV